MLLLVVIASSTYANDASDIKKSSERDSLIVEQKRLKTQLIALSKTLTDFASQRKTLIAAIPNCHVNEITINESMPEDENVKQYPSSDKTAVLEKTNCFDRLKVNQQKINSVSYNYDLKRNLYDKKRRRLKEIKQQL